MSHEAILYGRILGQERGRGGADYARILELQDLNRRVIEDLPSEDRWPPLCRGMFAFPAWPNGVFRTPIISFGASVKDDPFVPITQLPYREIRTQAGPLRAYWEEWFNKFEALLRRLYWWSAALFLVTDFERQQLFRWTPSDPAIAGLFAEVPRPISEWVRSAQHIDEKTGILF